MPMQSITRCYTMVLGMIKETDKINMKLNENNEKIVYDGEDMVNILKELDYILISLHQMGSYYADKSDGNKLEYERETTQFIDETAVSERLASIRAKLSESFDRTLGEDDMDDLERACMDIEYWTKPGDRCKDRYI